MKRTSIYTALALVSLLGACDRRDQPENAPTPDAAASPEPVPVTDPTAPVASSPDQMPATDPMNANPADNDGLALGLLAAANQHEIEAAQQAQSKKVTGEVLAYAKMMEKEHGENLAATKALGNLADTEEVRAMSEKGKQDLAKLGEKSGKEYEKAYVDAMVSGHTEVLALIDDKLMPLASAGPVADHMKETRKHVEMHLQAAKKLQGS